MANILKISTASVIGLHVTLFLAKSPGQSIATKAVAEGLKVSASHLSKVLQRLAKAGIVRATRGPGGGHILSRPLSEIRLRDILEAIEGPIKLSNCLRISPSCGDNGCMLGDLLESINSQVLQHFEKRLSEICAQ
jgi:Rrf2 family protein